MRLRILVTGSAGLIGRPLCAALRGRGVEVARLDLHEDGAGRGDLCDPKALSAALVGVGGIVHLAAVSRVIEAEQDPARCAATNVDGLQRLIDQSLSSPRRPWLLFTSSREVYGHPDRLPVHEEAPLRPVNVYGRSKAEGEALVRVAQSRGLRAAILRLSNVYGSTADHPDRVVPAFARAAAQGAELRVDGPDHVFDFTHTDDVVRGILALVDRLDTGEPPPPPIQLVSGRAVRLGELARLAIALSPRGATLRAAPPRDFDVSCFVGDPDRAQRLLGWSAQVDLRAGLSHLIRAFGAGDPP